MAIRGIVAVWGIYTLYLHIFGVELYLTLYLNYHYRSGLVHWGDHKFYQSKYNSYIFMQQGSVSLHLHIINTSHVVLDGAVLVLEVEGDEQLILFTCLLLSVVGPK